MVFLRFFQRDSQDICCRIVSEKDVTVQLAERLQESEGEGGRDGRGRVGRAVRRE